VKLTTHINAGWGVRATQQIRTAWFPHARTLRPSGFSRWTAYRSTPRPSMKKACQQCVRSHLRCSGEGTEGPCTNCEKRSVACLPMVQSASSPVKRWRSCAVDVSFLDLDTPDHQKTFTSCMFRFSQNNTEGSPRAASKRRLLIPLTAISPEDARLVALLPLAVVHTALPLPLAILSSASSLSPPQAGMLCEAPWCQELGHVMCEPCMHRLCQLCNLQSMASMKFDCVCCGKQIETVRIL
jgi:hypothetical protein